MSINYHEAQLARARAIQRQIARADNQRTMAARDGRTGRAARKQAEIVTLAAELASVAA